MPMTIASTKMVVAWLSTTARSWLRRIPSDFSRASSRRRWRTEATIVRARASTAAIATPSAMVSGNSPICWKFRICAAGSGGSVYMPPGVPSGSRRRMLATAWRASALDLA
jgi:hypothetical protein